MDEKYLVACARYVEMNPVRARLAAKPEEWRWSSARAHLGMVADELVDAAAMAPFVSDWAAFLAEALDNEEYEKIRAGERTGRPLGSSAFVQKLEDHLKRPLARQKPGRKAKTQPA